MQFRSSMTLVAGTVIIAMSFLNVFVLVTTGNKADIWLIITALGLILIAMSSMLSEIESQTLIFKNIEDMMKKSNGDEKRKMIDEEKLKAYEKIADEAYDSACRICSTIEPDASGYFKDKLTLILFEKILPPMWKI